MPIKDKPQPPKARRIGSIFLLLSSLFLLVNLLFPNLFAPPVPRVPYSLFIHQVSEGEVARASVGQNDIRYQLKNSGEQTGQVLSTTPIFDLSLPNLLEEKVSNSEQPHLLTMGGLPVCSVGLYHR
jgi:cell division protease FtsH